MGLTQENRRYKVRDLGFPQEKSFGADWRAPPPPLLTDISQKCLLAKTPPPPPLVTIYLYMGLSNGLRPFPLTTPILPLTFVIVHPELALGWPYRFMCTALLMRGHITLPLPMQLISSTTKHSSILVQASYQQKRPLH